MKPDTQDISPEFLCLKYKGVPAPWEFIVQSKRFGYKCKKYANWSDVHVSEHSRDLLKSIGNSLIDAQEFDILEYGELSRIWERVQRWTKDKENLSLEPDILLEYEKLARIIDIGSNKPDVVDLVIDEFGFELDSIRIDNRWIVFLSICIYNFFQSNKRYNFLHPGDQNDVNYFSSVKDLFDYVESALVQLYLQIGFDVSANDCHDSIPLFVKELGLNDSPLVTDRNAIGKIKTLPKVWVEKFEGAPSELVKFYYSEGSIVVKINNLNRIFKSKSQLAETLSGDEFWNLIGFSLHSHINQIDDIQDFFDTFAKQVRLRG